MRSSSIGVLLQEYSAYTLLSHRWIYWVPTGPRAAGFRYVDSMMEVICINLDTAGLQDLEDPGGIYLYIYILWGVARFMTRGACAYVDGLIDSLVSDRYYVPETVDNRWD